MLKILLLDICPASLLRSPLVMGNTPAQDALDNESYLVDVLKFHTIAMSPAPNVPKKLLSFSFCVIACWNICSIRSSVCVMCAFGLVVYNIANHFSLSACHESI